jgi:hypothetical protein
MLQVFSTASQVPAPAYLGGCVVQTGSWEPYIFPLSEALFQLDGHPYAANWKDAVRVQSSFLEIAGRSHDRMRNGIGSIEALMTDRLLSELDDRRWAGPVRGMLRVGSLEEVAARRLFPGGRARSKHEALRFLSRAIVKAGRPSEAMDVTRLANLSQLISSMDGECRPFSVRPQLRGGSGPGDSFVVMDAEAGAGIYMGLRGGVKKGFFIAAASHGADLRGALNFVGVKAGDAFALPAGTPFLIGAGIRAAWREEGELGLHEVRFGETRASQIRGALEAIGWDAPRGPDAVESYRAAAQ